MPENSTHKCTNAVNNVQPIRNSSHMAKILSVYNRLQAGDYENGNGGKRRVSRLTQFIHATLQLIQVYEQFLTIQQQSFLFTFCGHCINCRSKKLLAYFFVDCMLPNNLYKKLSWCWQRARRVCRSVEVNKHFRSIPSKIIKNNSE